MEVSEPVLTGHGVSWEGPDLMLLCAVGRKSNSSFAPGSAGLGDARVYMVLL